MGFVPSGKELGQDFVDGDSPDFNAIQSDEQAR
jgi:hypothetical protein